MPARAHLPQLDGGLFLTDGGIETTLIFHARDRPARVRRLPVLLDDEGRDALARLLRRPTCALAARARRRLRAREPDLAREPATGASGSATTPTSSTPSTARAIDADGRAAREHGTPPTPVVDQRLHRPARRRLRPGDQLDADEARRPTTPPRSGPSPTPRADLVTAITMTYAEEAIGIARAAAARRHAGRDLVHGRDRRPAARAGSRWPTRSAQVDAETGGAPAYFMVNCAHPTHFADVLAPDAGLAPSASAGCAPTRRARATPSSTRRPSSTPATRPSSARATRRCARQLPRLNVRRRLLRHRRPARRRDRSRLG